ncbi:YggS family pyridoxal phosphate-dependent enzyme [Yeguia hominis]|uniref:Pyridoxal phosphate homeostasis protein n=1 Tax=Yeguia hominis TaxID=2763662 RepID=A0A926D9K8_9FIRM|nr:YggS family pyridoxal phosphate-dependent enzyme [Yeguia hominis]MBC8532905.1 YggS family pyridoxal phosphate-dependent enzyme [Yeguia hominis]
MMEGLLHDDALQTRFLSVEENLKEIRERIAEAALKSGRAPEDVTLLAATKTVPVEVINHAIHLGVDHIGENRVQELLDKYDALDLSDCACHFIGHLQTNKVKYLVGRVGMIQSVDSMKLAKEISRLSVYQGLSTDILIEVNIGREENKSGVLPEALDELLDEISTLPSIRLRGLMAIPPVSDDLSQTMTYFSKMYEYYVDIKEKKSDNKRDHIDVLSMGMSADYAQAVECGATLVRVGSSLFGKRIY